MQGFSHFSTEKLVLKCKINPTDEIKKKFIMLQCAKVEMQMVNTFKHSQKGKDCFKKNNKIIYRLIKKTTTTLSYMSDHHYFPLLNIG